MLFTKMGLSASEKATLDHDGHVLLPGHLTPEAQTLLTAALAEIEVQAKIGAISKSGAGALTLSGSNSFNRQLRKHATL